MKRGLFLQDALRVLAAGVQASPQSAGDDLLVVQVNVFS
jgi:hypothetical protein